MVVFGNPAVTEPGLSGLAKAFTTAPGGAYQPLAFLSYRLDLALWGADPRAFHAGSVLLHALCAALAVLAARRLLGLAAPAEPSRALDAAALAAALLWALHPLRVESVSWIAERRDPLCAAFWLSAVLAHIAGRRGLTAGLFLLACLSKATAVTLPVVLIAIDSALLRRPLRDAVRAQAPLFAAGLAVGLAAVAFQSGARASWSWSGHGPIARLAQACYALTFYPLKSLWPAGLSPFYELYPPLNVLEWRFISSFMVVVGLSILASKRRVRWPFAVYAVILLPVSGLLQSGAQLVADRYSYLSTLPLGLLAGAVLLGVPYRRPALACAFLACAALAAAAVRQQSHWRDDESLWRRALAVDPVSPTAWLNLGGALAGAGRVPQAAAAFEHALEGDPACLPNAGDAAALETRPVCRRGLANLGTARAQLGDLEEARRLLRLAVDSDPADAAARGSLARVESMLVTRLERSR